MKPEKEGYFFEPLSLTECKKQTKMADTGFEKKVLRTRRVVCLIFQITSDCTGTEYCKP